VLLALAVLAACGGPSSPPAPAPSSGDVVRTTGGDLRGLSLGDHREFLGIPYAAPPTGQLRWRPPAPTVSWTGVRAATRLGPACPQPDRSGTSEDCLFANVYTPPASSGTSLPVILWLHGGSFDQGSGGDVNGTFLTTVGRVILVTINYRLGPLGFLAPPGPGGDQDAGLYGLLDQQAALRWVQANIAAFGGDPRRVTLAGESAGGASVCLNLISPSARGLFSRAIMESGCAQHPRSRAEADDQGQRLAAAVGCGGANALACLREQPAKRLVTAATSVPGLGWEPVVGSPTVPEPALSALAAGRFSRVPVLQGTTRDEGGLFVVPSQDSRQRPLTAAAYPAAAQAQFGGLAPAVLRQYPADHFTSPGQALATAVGDARFSCRALVSNALFSAYVPTYMYEFDDAEAPGQFPFTATFPLGAYHGSELLYLFRYGISHPEQLSLSAQMMRYWSAFAAEGRPAVTGAPVWPAFSTRTTDVLGLAPGRTARGSDFGDRHNCAFWSSFTG
jgi:para-nitrobenzyl esterase